MDLNSIWTIFLFFFSILACRPITVLVHELGHAIPALLFTQKPVTIYVGSYGDRSKSLFFNLGRLQSFVSYDIFQSQMGLCYHSSAKTIQQTLLIILGGPLASLLFGLLLIVLVSNFIFPPMLNFVFYMLLVSAIFDFFVNMIPSKNPSYLFDGTPVYNDGNSFFKLLKESKYPENYFKAIDFYSKEKNKRAIHNFHSVLEEGYTDKVVYNKLIAAYVNDQQYHRALNIYNTMLTQHQLNNEEYHNLAITYWKLKNYERAILACNKILNKNIALDSSNINPQTILLRGKSHLKLNQIEIAIEDFNQAISINSEFTSLGYSFRGLAKIKSHQLLDGKEDLDIAHALSPNNPHTIFHLGIYFYKKQDFNKAMDLFKKAQSIDETILDLEHYIASTLPYLGSRK